jgi:hypothetical protein
LLPAGAFAGWALHPLESTALPRRTPEAVIANPIRIWFAHFKENAFAAMRFTR